MGDTSNTQRVIVMMPPDLVAALDEAAEREDRSRAYMIRQAVTNAYTPTITTTSTTMSGSVRNIHNQLAPVTHTMNAVAASPPAAPNVPVHEFAPQGQNALRCRVCGGKKAAH